MECRVERMLEIIKVNDDGLKIGTLGFFPSYERAKLARKEAGEGTHRFGRPYGCDIVTIEGMGSFLLGDKVVVNE